jgi:hypothetical protein
MLIIENLKILEKHKEKIKSTHNHPTQTTNIGVG